MKTAVIFATKHGTTQKAAEYIAEKIKNEDVTLISVREDNINLELYDKIILGASIHMGVVAPEMKKFCNKNLEVLKTKKLGLYICGMEPNLNRQDYELEMAYPLELQSIAKAKAFIGGEILLEKMNFIQRTIVQFIIKSKKNVSQIHYDVLDHFIAEMNNV